MARRNKADKWLEDLKKHVEERDALGSDATFTDEYNGAPAFQKYVLTEEARSWKEFLTWVSAQQGDWYYRGQRESTWSLTTSLDRAIWRYKITKTGSSSHYLHRPTEERRLLFRFKQQAHQFLTHLPEGDDWCSWFSLMQHYNVPTRFVDWTTSPYVGMYFALEEEPEKKRCALWAINRNWLESKADAILEKYSAAPLPDDDRWRSEFLNKVFWTEREKGVIVAVNPLESNDRMAAQQGLFLTNLYEEARFYQVLMGMMIRPELTTQAVIKKLEVSVAHRFEFMKHLRAMNIHRSSLFPGLDGFGRYLKLDLEMKDWD